MDISPGMRASVSAAVTTADTALALGSGDVAVLGTPRVVALVEAAAVAVLKDRLDPGTTSVGTRIDLDHLDPTPVGGEVTATAVVEQVAGRRITFAVEASSGAHTVARGSHVRVVVDRDSFPA